MAASLSRLHLLSRRTAHQLKGTGDPLNADVLATMSQRARRWFLVWGLIIAVFVVRGLLPWLIVWMTTPSLGPIEALLATFSSDPAVVSAVEESAPILPIFGGMFLILLFFHWLFAEEKNCYLGSERFFSRQAVWFYAIASILLSVIVWFALQINTMMGFAAVLGSTVFLHRPRFPKERRGAGGPYDGVRYV